MCNYIYLLSVVSLTVALFLTLSAWDIQKEKNALKCSLRTGVYCFSLVEHTERRLCSLNETLRRTLTAMCFFYGQAMLLYFMQMTASVVMLCIAGMGAWLAISTNYKNRLKT